MRNVNKTQVNKYVAALAKKFNVPKDTFVVMMDGNGWSMSGAPVICGETGDLPYDWTLQCIGVLPNSDYYGEPINNCILALYYI